MAYQSVDMMMNVSGNKYFVHYYKYLRLLALQLFKWENLPSGVDERFLEISLQTIGHVAFVKHPEFKSIIVAQGSQTGMIDIYGRPVQYQCVFPNAANNFTANVFNYADELKDMCNAVVVYNNDFGQTVLPSLQLFADDLAHIKQVSKINVNNQKTPYIITTNQQKLMSIKKFQNHMDNDVSNIIVDEKIDPKSLSAVLTPAPYVADKLNEHLSFVWNELMTFLGIENSNQLKKERMVVDEVNKNDEQTKASENIYLKSREEACKLINELFGTNISVRIRTETVEKLEELAMKGGDI